MAEFFGVTEYEIRKAVKLTLLIPELASILETAPKQLNLACAGMMADYDPESQQAFIEMCRNESYRLNKAGMNYIVSKCPPPSAKRQELYAAWRRPRLVPKTAGRSAPKDILQPQAVRPLSGGTQRRGDRGPVSGVLAGAGCIS